MSQSIPRPDGPRSPVPMIRAKVPFRDDEIVEAVLSIADPEEDPTDAAAYWALWYPVAERQDIYSNLRDQKRMPVPVAARDPYVLHYALHKFKYDWQEERSRVEKELNAEERELTGVNNRLAKFEMRLDHRPGVLDPSMAELRDERRTELRRLKGKMQALLKEIDAERQLIRDYYDPLFAMADEVLFELRIRDSATVLNRAQTAVDAVSEQLKDTEQRRAQLQADAEAARASLAEFGRRYGKLQREAAELKIEAGALR